MKAKAKQIPKVWSVRGPRCISGSTESEANGAG
jgi:hypothetical protein